MSAEGASSPPQAEDGADGGDGVPAALAELWGLRPERQVEFEVGDEGRITLLEPKFRGRILGRWLQPRLARPHIHTHLDEVGSAVWQLCDGGTPVGALVQQLSERFGDGFDPDGRRLGIFLEVMERRGLIRYR